MRSHHTSKLMNRIPVSVLVLCVVSFGFFASDTHAASPESKRLAKQVTVVSVQDPIPGHAQHQLGMLLPPRKGPPIAAHSPTRPASRSRWSCSMPMTPT
jgi:hypothetical protein